MIDFHSQLPIIPNVYETAQLQDDLEHSGGVTISWKSAESTEIPLGSYITYKGMRYILLEPYAPSKSGIHYQYSPMFKHPQNMLDRVPFWITSRDADGNIIHLSTTSFTGTPFIIIKKICDFMAEYANEMQDEFFAETVGLELTDSTQPWNASTNPWKATWTFDDTKITETSKTIITVGFDGSSLKSAADAIASAMGCNLYWDWSAKKLMFISGTTITGDSYNCFHVLGGTTNMGKNTVSGGYAAVTQRLTLNTAQYPGSIIDCRPVDGQGRHYGIRLTKDLILDDIYPKMELYIKTARERLCSLTDNETGDFIVDHFEYFYMDGDTKKYSTLDHTTDGKYYDAQGHELTRENVYKTFAKWYLTFMKADGTDYTVDPRTILINDQPLGILFQLDLQDTTKMSSLVGNQFNATYFPAADDEWDKNDAKDDRTLRPSDEPWHINAGEYYINFEADGEIILPTTSKIVGGIETGLVPEVGKKVTLVNVALTTEEATAKEELLDAAMEIIGLMNTPAGEYSEPVIFAEPISGVQPPHTIEPKMVGDDSPFGNTHGPVVTNVDLNIDTNEATVTVGSWSRKTKTGGTADKVETVSVSAASATNGSDPYSTGDLGEGHYVPKTSSSSQTTIAQTQVKPSGAFVVSLTPDNQTIDCYANGKVKADTNLYMKIAAHYGSRDVTAGCRVAYTQALPQNVTMHLETSSSGTSGTSMAINTDYDLTNGLEWLRIFIPHNTDFSALSGVLARTLDLTHSAYGSRNVAITVSGIYDGAAGVAGAFKSTVFKRTNTTPVSAPTGGDYDHPVPSGWEDGIPNGEEMLWASVCTFKADGTSSGWSTPKQMTDTADFDVEFSVVETNPGDPTNNPANWSNSASASTIWMATREKHNGVWSGWQIAKIKGEAGERGGNTATVNLYQRKSTAPTSKPGRKLYYQFSTKKLYTDSACEHEVTDSTPNMNNWKTYIPDGTDDLWVTSAIAFSQTDVDDIDYSPNNEWVTPAKLVINGTDGTDGINTAPVFLYCRAASQPTKPQNTVYYKFADGKLYTTAECTTEVNYPLEDTWYRDFPTSDGNPCWVVQAAALSNNDYDPIPTGDWSGVKKMVEDGADAQSMNQTVQTYLEKIAVGAYKDFESGYAYSSDNSIAIIYKTGTSWPTGISKGDVWYNGNSAKVYINSASYENTSIDLSALHGYFSAIGASGDGTGTSKLTVYRNTLPTTGLQQYDLFVNKSSFTDKFTGATIDGAVGVWIYYDGNWEYVVDNTFAAVQNFGNAIVNAVFGSSSVPTGSTNYASALTLSSQLAALYTSGTAQDGTNAVAALKSIIKTNNGHPMSVVEISADLIDFFSKTITFKENSESTGPCLNIGFGSVTVYPYHQPAQTVSTVYMTFGIGSTTYAKLAIIPNISGNPYVSFAIEGDVIADRFITRYLNTSTGGMEEIAGASGSFYDGEGNLIAVKNGIIVGTLPND